MFIKIPSACLTIVPRPIYWTQLLTARKTGLEGPFDNNRRAKVQLFALLQGGVCYFFAIAFNNFPKILAFFCTGKACFTPNPCSWWANAGAERLRAAWPPGIPCPYRLAARHSSPWFVQFPAGCSPRSDGRAISVRLFPG